MKKVKWVLVGLIALVLLLIGGYAMRKAHPNADAVIHGEIIVGFKKGVTLEEAQAVMKKFGLEFTQSEHVNLGRVFYDKTDLKFVVKVPNGKEGEWCQNLVHEPGVYDTDLSYDPQKMIVD